MYQASTSAAQYHSNFKRVPNRYENRTSAMQGPAQLQHKASALDDHYNLGTATTAQLPIVVIDFRSWCRSGHPHPHPPAPTSDNRRPTTDRPMPRPTTDETCRTDRAADRPTERPTILALAVRCASRATNVDAVTALPSRLPAVLPTTRPPPRPPPPPNGRPLRFRRAAKHERATKQATRSASLHPTYRSYVSPSVSECGRLSRSARPAA